MRSGGMPAGSSRALRLDPFSLPARFAATDAAADERVRHVELYRERVVVRRRLRGMRMALNMPVSAFAGVAIRVVAGEGEAEATVAVTLEHKDPSLALPLFISGEADEAFAEWRAWANVLGLPLLVAEDDGVLREPFARIGRRAHRTVRPRRRRRSALKRRRPSMPLRRQAGKLTEATPVHRGEREIIAQELDFCGRPTRRRGAGLHVHLGAVPPLAVGCGVWVPALANAPGGTTATVA